MGYMLLMRQDPETSASPPLSGPFHQFDRYYKDGHFDDCKKKFADLSFCFKLKAAGREQTKVWWRREQPQRGSQ